MEREILHTLIINYEFKRCLGLSNAKTWLCLPNSTPALRARGRLGCPVDVLGTSAFVPHRPRHTLRPPFFCHRQRSGSWPFGVPGGCPRRWGAVVPRRPLHTLRLPLTPPPAAGRLTAPGEGIRTEITISAFGERPSFLAPTTMLQKGGESEFVIHNSKFIIQN